MQAVPGCPAQCGPRSLGRPTAPRGDCLSPLLSLCTRTHTTSRRFAFLLHTTSPIYSGGRFFASRFDEQSRKGRVPRVSADSPQNPAMSLHHTARAGVKIARRELRFDPAMGLPLAVLLSSALCLAVYVGQKEVRAKARLRSPRSPYAFSSSCARAPAPPPTSPPPLARSRACSSSGCAARTRACPSARRWPWARRRWPPTPLLTACTWVRPCTT